MKGNFIGDARRRAGALPWSLLLLMMLATPFERAAAHALVLESQPPARGQVSAGEVAIDLRFNSRLDRKRARLRLIAGDGAARDLPIAEDDSAEHLRATAGTLAPGDYRIEWYVLSPDGHVTRGNVPFTVQ